jgi:peptidoglycan hydrolase-like protein with peptidoglycan-binding domain
MKRLAGILLLVASFLVVSPARAATIPELEKIISDLKAQIVELQSRLQASAVQKDAGAIGVQKITRTPAPLPAFEDLKPARYGEYSGSVRTLQSELTARGYYDGPITGRYAQATREAVKKFQKDNALPGDGRVVNAQMISRISESLCTLSVSVSSDIASQTITAGTEHVPLAKLMLTAPKNCGVTISKISVALETDGTAVKNVVEDIRVFAGEKEIGFFASPSWVNTLRDINLVLAPSESASLMIEASVVGVGNGVVQAGLSYIEAVKTGTTTNVGNKRSYLGEKMKLVAPPEEENSIDGESQETI